MSPALAELGWPDIPMRPLVLVPVGSIEQHGPQLPIDTDTSIAVAVAEAVAARLGPDTMVAPALAYGSSGEHQSFPGTSSIGGEALQTVIIELVRSVANWAGRIVFVNAHGGNTAALTRAVPQLIIEQHRVAWVPCVSPNADLHAGRTETSLMLHLRPQSVNLSRAAAGDVRPIDEILPLLVEGGVAAVSANGVLGDPTGANAAEGERLLASMIHDVAERIVAARPDRQGKLLRTAIEARR